MLALTLLFIGLSFFAFYMAGQDIYVDRSMVE
jgi:hypothetical protein